MGTIENKRKKGKNSPRTVESNNQSILMTSEVARRWWRWLKMKATVTAFDSHQIDLIRLEYTRTNKIKEKEK
jgi:hypothetical protein